MKIETSRFGEIEISDELIFDFVSPIIGYDSLSKFVILENKEGSLFSWLQSVEDGDIAFPITIASYFNIDYTFQIDDANSKLLEIDSPEDLLVVNIAKIPQGQPRKTTINLLGPVVINVKNKKGMQLVLSGYDFSASYPIFNDTENKQEDLELI